MYHSLIQQLQSRQVTNDETHTEEGYERSAAWAAYRAARSDSRSDHRDADVHGIHTGR